MLNGSGPIPLALKARPVDLFHCGPISSFRVESRCIDYGHVHCSPTLLVQAHSLISSNLSEEIEVMRKSGRAHCIFAILIIDRDVNTKII